MGFASQIDAEFSLFMTSWLAWFPALFAAWFSLVAGAVLRRLRAGPREAGVLAGEIAAAALPAAMAVFGLQVLGVGFAELSEIRWWHDGTIARVSLLAACLPGLFLALAPSPRRWAGWC